MPQHSSLPTPYTLAFLVKFNISQYSSLYLYILKFWIYLLRIICHLLPRLCMKRGWYHVLLWLLQQNYFVCYVCTWILSQRPLSIFHTTFFLLVLSRYLNYKSLFHFSFQNIIPCSYNWKIHSALVKFSSSFCSDFKYTFWFYVCITFSTAHLTSKVLPPLLFVL
jgi:hypothetical protein